MKTEVNYIIEKLNKEEANWFGAKQECYKIRFSGGFAPIHLFAAIDERGRYTDNPVNGYIHGNGNTGTCSMLLAGTEEQVKEILKSVLSI